jgi:hypothetical protein
MQVPKVRPIPAWASGPGKKGDDSERAESPTQVLREEWENMGDITRMERSPTGNIRTAPVVCPGVLLRRLYDSASHKPKLRQAEITRLQSQAELGDEKNYCVTVAPASAKPTGCHPQASRPRREVACGCGVGERRAYQNCRLHRFLAPPTQGFPVPIRTPARAGRGRLGWP